MEQKMVLVKKRKTPKDSEIVSAEKNSDSVEN